MPECFGQLIVLIPTKKTLANGLNPELAAKAGNALQKVCDGEYPSGNSDVFSGRSPHGHMAIGATVFPTGIGMAATLLRN